MSPRAVAAFRVLAACTYHKHTKNTITIITCIKEYKYTEINITDARI